MRKVLLASAALLGASGSLAFAQAPNQAANPLTSNPNQGQFAAPYGSGPAANNNNNAWGVANTPTGSPAAGGLSGSIYSPNVTAVPAPGTVVIRLNGRVESDFEAAFTSLNTGVGTPSAANPSGAGYKLNPLGIATYMRLYPGFDGVAANGIRYGAAIELRENFYAGTSGSVNSTVTTLGGQPVGTGGATSGSGNTSAQTVFVRRAFTYLATDQAGLLRIGQGDGVLGLFDNCIFTSQCWDAGVGNFNGGGPQGFLPGAADPPFVWLAQAGAEYGNAKVVYLSPQFYGFDFGAQYAPSMGNAFSDSTGASPLQQTTCNQAGQNCVGVTSGNDPTRWYNQVGVGLRYQQAFGAVDVKTYGFWETAGKENLTTAAYLPPQSVVGGKTVFNGPGRLMYDNLNFYKFGAAITAFNTTAAVDYIGGAINGQLSMRPQGGAPTNAVLGGLTYANGPMTLGIEYGVIDTQGQANLTHISQRHEYEFATGGAYKVAPGLQLVAEYMYTHRHQGDYNFATGAVGDGTHDVQSQGFVLSTVVTW